MAQSEKRRSGESPPIGSVTWEHSMASTLALRFSIHPRASVIRLPGTPALTVFSRRIRSVSANLRKMHTKTEAGRFLKANRLPSVTALSYVTASFQHRKSARRISTTRAGNEPPPLVDHLDLILLYGDQFTSNGRDSPFWLRWSLASFTLITARYLTSSARSNSPMRVVHVEGASGRRQSTSKPDRITAHLFVGR